MLVFSNIKKKQKSKSGGNLSIYTNTENNKYLMNRIK